MTSSASGATVPVQHPDRFFIGGEWVAPSTDSKINVIDSHTESGIGREGGVDGLLPFLESKAMLLDGPTAKYTDVQL